MKDIISEWSTILATFLFIEISMTEVLPLASSIKQSDLSQVISVFPASVSSFIDRDQNVGRIQ